METGDWVKACCYGSVAASFLVEQVGLPVRSGLGPFELWNGEDVRSQLRIVLGEMGISLRKLMAMAEQLLEFSHCYNGLGAV